MKLRTHAIMAALATTAVLAVTSCQPTSAGGEPVIAEVSTPPARLQAPPHGAYLVVTLSTREEVANMCQGDNEYLVLACMKVQDSTPIVYLPNPCQASGQYAALFCHEQAHVNQAANGELDGGQDAHEGWSQP